MVSRTKSWGALLASAIVILLALHYTAPHLPIPWETSIMGRLSDARTVGLDRTMLAATWLGSLFVLGPAALIIGIRLARRGQGNQARLLASSLFGAALLGRIAKWWIERPRPDVHTWLSSLPVDSSYPSLHTMQAVAFFLALALIFGKKSYWPIAFVMATVIAISRLYLQVHFPTDIIAGTLAAAVWTLTLYKLRGALFEK